MPPGFLREQYSCICSLSRRKYLPQRLQRASQPPLSISASISRSTAALSPQGIYTRGEAFSIWLREML